MPRIPLYHHEPVASQPSSVRANPGMYDGLAQAGRNLGNAISGAGDQMQDYAITKTKVEEFKHTNDLKIGMNAAWDDFQSKLNKSTDEAKWGEEWDKKLDATVAAISPKNASQYTRNAMAQEAKAFKAARGGDIKLQARASFIQKGIQSGEAVGESLVAKGDTDGYERHLNSMADAGLIFRESIEGKMREAKVTIQHQVARSELRDLLNLPPAEMKATSSAYGTSLFDKNEKGDYVNFPDLTEVARLNLQDQAERQTRAAQQAMDVEGDRLVRSFRSGRGTLQDGYDAMIKGLLDEATAAAIMPEIVDADNEYKGKQAEKLEAKEAKELAAAESKTARDEARALARSVRHASAIDTLRDKVLSRWRGGFLEIEQSLALDRISADDAKSLSEELKQISASELSDDSDGSPVELIRAAMRGGILDRMFGRETSDAEYKTILEAIAGAEVTKETRLKLMDEFFVMKLADFRQGSEETDNFADRRISKPERAMREEVVEEYKTLLPSIGGQAAGAMYFNQEAAIRSFFDSAGINGRSAGEINEFKEKAILKPLRDAAGKNDFYGMFE